MSTGGDQGPDTPHLRFAEWLTFIHPRGVSTPAVVIVQLSMIMSAILILGGLIYVLCLVVTIIAHHYLYDRNPRKVPTYVKRAIQFESDSDSEEEEDSSKPATPKAKQKPKGTVEVEIMESASETDSEQLDPRFIGKARKIGNLDKFLQKDLDVIYK